MKGSCLIDLADLTITGITPDRIATIYVEDVSSFNAVVATTSEIGAGNEESYAQSGDDSRLTFSIAKDLTLNSLDVRIKTWSDVGTELSIFTAGGVQVGRSFSSTTSGSTAGGLVSSVSVDFAGLALGAGNYYIQQTGGADVTFFNDEGNAYTSAFQYSGEDVLQYISKGTGSSVTEVSS